MTADDGFVLSFISANKFWFRLKVESSVAGCVICIYRSVWHKWWLHIEKVSAFYLIPNWKRSLFNSDATWLPHSLSHYSLLYLPPFVGIQRILCANYVGISLCSQNSFFGTNNLLRTISDAEIFQKHFNDFISTIYAFQMKCVKHVLWKCSFFEKKSDCCQREETEGKKTIQSHWNINRAILVRNQNPLAIYNCVACNSHLFMHSAHVSECLRFLLHWNFHRKHNELEEKRENIKQLLVAIFSIGFLYG